MLAIKMPIPKLKTHNTIQILTSSFCPTQKHVLYIYNSSPLLFFIFFPPNHNGSSFHIFLNLKSFSFDPIFHFFLSGFSITNLAILAIIHSKPCRLLVPFSFIPKEKYKQILKKYFYQKIKIKFCKVVHFFKDSMHSGSEST